MSVIAMRFKIFIAVVFELIFRTVYGRRYFIFNFFQLHN